MKNQKQQITTQQIQGFLIVFSAVEVLNPVSSGRREVSGAGLQAGH